MLCKRVLEREFVHRLCLNFCQHQLRPGQQHLLSNSIDVLNGFKAAHAVASIIPHHSQLINLLFCRRVKSRALVNKKKTFMQILIT